MIMTFKTIFVLNMIGACGNLLIFISGIGDGGNLTIGCLDAICAWVSHTILKWEKA